ncbi:uncharacterized protein LOC113847435 isoform X3 [Abrus precatorius]|uniref:Uncharacterized protein LOC113847435 isoform X3 n=1 Tax=Abrus precatorius TaxID=3816 RepID=A0A8B8JLJ4_ABRPR|nr:uncharacterized protein LOC113847435 isoform X3 [Abrus precatorius]
MEEATKEESEKMPQIVEVLEALKQASHDIQQHHSSDSPSVKALLELQTILASDPNLSALSNHLNRLKTLVHTLNRSNGLRSFLTRPLSTHSLARVAASIESEIQAWIDRETLHTLSASLNNPLDDEDELVSLLTQFQDRVSQGFNRELQDLVLKLKLFPSLQSVLLDAKCSNRVRERTGLAVAALIRFNKDVFVGEVLMGPTVRALLSMASPLSLEDLQLRVLGFECLLEIGYFGRKEAVEAMLKEGVVKKLMELQRSEKGGDLIGLDRAVEKKERVSGFLEKHPFASCVARFAVQLEVGEGLRQREKRAFKPEILVRVKEASSSDAEAATIVAEVLWGSSP